MLDSGAQTSFMSAAEALSVGVTADMLASDRKGIGNGVVAGGSTIHAHRFQSLKVGVETITNPTLIVFERVDAGSAMVLGGDYLRTHRLWISYASRKLFLGRQTRPAAPE